MPQKTQKQEDQPGMEYKMKPRPQADDESYAGSHAGGKENPRQCGRPRTDLDAPDPGNIPG